jgi:hypothetical protein
MFNIAQFGKFDLLLLINVMAHHRAGWEHAAWAEKLSWSRFALRLIARHAQGWCREHTK